MNHVVIAIPAYTGVVHLGTMRSLMTDLLTLTKRGDSVEVIDDCGSTDLPDARAAMAARFLAGPGTHLINLDNDVAWQAGALVRLVDYPVDVVGGVYPKREDPISYPVRYLDRPELHADPDTGLLEVEAIQGGFVCYSRACIQRMADEYRSLSFRSSRYPDLELPGLWREVMVGDRKLGEDFAFFHRWRAIGGQVWCDPDITMAHVGLKAFIGNFGQWLRNRPQS
jgi:hypothetical protein